MEEENMNQNEKETEKKLHKRVCPYCKQEIKTQVGISNWKNLFKKPTADDWITLIILIFLMIAVYAYINETKQCRETLKNLDKICLIYNKVNQSQVITQVITIPNATFVPENITNNSGLLEGRNNSNASG